MDDFAGLKRSPRKGLTRYGLPGLACDVIRLDGGAVRIGSVPEITKLLGDKSPQHIVVPPWQVTPLGDSFAGEEFVMWRTIFGQRRPHFYYGAAATLARLKRRLDYTVPWDFDEARIRVVKRDWLDEVFIPVPGTGRREAEHFVLDQSHDLIAISEQNKPVYCEPWPPESADILGRLWSLEAPLSLPRPLETGMEITVVGSGNGFYEDSSSFVVRWQDTIIGVDPPAYPVQSLAGLGLRASDLTALLITHNHEDHIGGVLPLVEWARARDCKLKLISCWSIWELLQKQFAPYPLADHVEFIQIEPNETLKWRGGTITARWNHHCLPTVTLGLKFAFEGNQVGISGDTLYTPEMAKYLKRPELSSDWFGSCALLFHEVAPDSKFSIHTRPDGLAHIQSKIKCTLRAYHSSPEIIRVLPCPRARRGERYRVVRRKVQVSE